MLRFRVSRIGGWIDGALEFWPFRRDQSDRPAGVLFAHIGLEVGGGEVGGLFLLEHPVTAEAVGDSGKDGVEVQRVAVAQAADIVMAGEIEAGVETGFDAPVRDVMLQPLLCGEFPQRTAGQKANRLGGYVLALAQHTGGLGGKGMSRLFAVDLGTDESAHDFLFFLNAFFARPARIAQVKKGVSDGSSTIRSIWARRAGWLSLTVWR